MLLVNLRKPLVATEFILRSLNVNFTTLYVYKYKATSEAQSIYHQYPVNLRVICFEDGNLEICLEVHLYSLH